MKTLFLSLCLAVCLTGCNKNGVTPFKSQGIITGEYFGPCYNSECGGLEITIKNDPTKNPPPFYWISSSLPQLGISASTPFPINVTLNWKHDTSTYNYIIVTQIKVIK